MQERWSPGYDHKQAHPETRSLRLYYENSKFYFDRKVVSLTTLQHRLLYVLYENQGVVVPFTTLKERLYGRGQTVPRNRLHGRIDNLRAKLGCPECIEAVRGQGYKLINM